MSQKTLFNEDIKKKWNEHWKNMPEFVQNDLGPIKSIKVNFQSENDLKKFSELIGQNVTMKTTHVWYPKKEKENLLNYEYIIEE